MANKIKEISNIQLLLSAIEEFKKDFHSQFKMKLWFRGHSDNSWELKPSVYRKTFPTSIGGEGSRLEIEQNLTQDFRVFSAGLRKGNENNSELYFLQQHYRMPTRLLDWTNNALTALFFAVCENQEKDGELFLMEASAIAPRKAGKKYNGDNFYGIATGTNPVFINCLKTIFEWKTLDNFPDFIIPVRPDYFDKRMSLQRSCFTFHVPKEPELNKTVNFTLTSFQIPKKAKVDLMKELSLLGIDHFNTYGDLEGLANTLKINYGIR